MCMMGKGRRDLAPLPVARCSSRCRARDGEGEEGTRAAATGSLQLGPPSRA